MPILSRDVSLPLFMCIEEDASLRLPALLSEHHLEFTRPLLVTGGNAPLTHARRIAATLAGFPEVFSVSGSTVQEAEALKRKIDTLEPDLIIGVGGGVVLDVAKYAASEKAVAFLSVPTTVSNDGITSPVSVIRFNGRTKSLNTHMPVAVVADLTVIRTAPGATIQSGVGDLISNLSACADWRLAYRRGRETMDEFTETISRNAALRILEAPRGGGLTDTDFLKVLIEGLIMSGIAMGICGSSRPGSGAEHMVSHAIDRFLKKESRHGIQAGVSTLFTLRLHGMDITPIKSLFRDFSMPSSPSDLSISREEFLLTVSKAPLMRPGRYSILNEADQSAIDQAYHEAFE